MITQATGILSEDGALRFHRRFGAPLDEVWAWITDPDQSAKWIGRWTGDPSTGSLHLHVDTEAARGTQDLVIETCAPPRELVVRLETWQVGLTLSHGNSVTTVELAQGIDDADDAEQVGPVWDYYLDRLTAATSHGDLEGMSFDDYRRLARHYRKMYKRQKPIRQPSTMPRT